MLLELAVGDAYGAGFEYVNGQLIRQFNTLERYHKHPTHSGTKPGMYTDDTQMSLAIAEAILSGERWTPLNLATRFVECFKRDQREGYSQRFWQFLKQVRDGDDFLARIEPHSEKSGASMRAAPIGVYPSVGEVIKRCTIQAAITHNTPNGINAACAAALMSHYFIYNYGPKADLPEFLETHVPGQWSVEYRGKVKSKGWMSVRAAITALMGSDSMSDLLKKCIDFTGDVDTVAAIALAAGSCSREVEQDLPDHLIATLENGAYGREYIQALDAKLMALTSIPFED
jgi:ADP-ribosyl-[dinitrogen reductase] hydrolase